MEIFRKRLKGIRNIRKLKQREVAAALNLDRTAYTKYENEKHSAEPSLSTLRDLCLLMNVSADYLLDLPNDLPYLTEN